jgi:hypothetical protein
MNGTQLRNELEQCLSWANYASDYASFELYNKDIAPLDSEYFTLEQAEALYHYVCEFSITFDNFYCRAEADFAILWLNYSSVMGMGTDVISAANDLLDQIVMWYKQNEN